MQLTTQVMHSYGVKPNEDFLRYYGFVDTDNIHDSYTVDLLEWIKQRYHLPEEGLLAVEADTAALHALQHVSACLPPNHSLPQHTTPQHRFNVVKLKTCASACKSPFPSRLQFAPTYHTPTTSILHDKAGGGTCTSACRSTLNP